MLKPYGLRERRFSLLPTPHFMYLSEQYLETKAKLLYFLEDRPASLYLHGPIGCGKTSLLRLMVQEIDEDRSTDSWACFFKYLRSQIRTLVGESRLPDLPTSEQQPDAKSHLVG